MVDLAEAFAAFDDHWSPKIVARINDMELKVVKVKGDFVWHRHEETDEFFMVHRGRVTIELRDREVPLSAGQCFVVPRGVEHRPRADAECELLLLEPAGTVNTGDAGGDRTITADPWIASR
ncbi:MAG: cupin domain-containing protein [Chloroflexota bacterium]|nr:cupin domain-containing protein [Chloroflexota bacterium]